MDWNDDGKKDLLVGEHDGHIRIYLNTNVDASPVFQGYHYLECGGSDFDCGEDSMPFVVDWNNDGKKDLLCGTYTGDVLLLINVGTEANPIFQFAQAIRDGMSKLHVGTRSSPGVADWNNDGKKDLLVSESGGKFHCFENQGTDAEPRFNGGMYLQEISTSSAHIDVTDWDGDGVEDVLSGEYYGYVWLFRELGPLALDTNALSAGTGGKVRMDLDAEAANAGRNYLILGSAGGTEPGIPLPGGEKTLPLNQDFFTDFVFMLINTPVFANFLGKLDANGTAKATFDTIKPLTGGIGLELHFAYALNNPWDFVSNPAAIEIVP